MLHLSHKNLEVYKIALLLLQEVYRITGDFPREEQYALVLQSRKAAVSVCSNIAEGASRLSAKEKKRFYEIARGSVVEIDTQIEVAQLLCYFEPMKKATLQGYIVSVFKMLSKMIVNLNCAKRK